MDTVEVELDSRQRLPLARIVGAGQRRFRVEHLPSGELLLTPVVSISERELAVLRNPERMVSIQHGIEQATKGELGRRYTSAELQGIVEDFGPEEAD